MPHIDARTGDVVIRIVYDGAPEAGKTTNVQHLVQSISLQRRGASKSPGTPGARTEFFDWLDFSGGYLDGRRVRCQLVSVPGQSSLLHRRKYLLETADAIVFVTDSRPDQLNQSSINLASTLRILDKLSGAFPVGVVLQANKQDLPFALPPTDVAGKLGINKLTPIVGSVAAKGDGVMQTFVLAMRLATDRVRVMLVGDELAQSAEAAADPDTLYSQMLKNDEREAKDAARLESEAREKARVRALEQQAELRAKVEELERIETARRQALQNEAAAKYEAQRAERSRRQELTTVPEQHPRVFRVLPEPPLTPPLHPLHPLSSETASNLSREPVPHPPMLDALPSEAIAKKLSAQSLPPETSRVAQSKPIRKNCLSVHASLPLPQATEIASGHVWPPVKGRSSVAVATAGRLSIPENVQRWAPVDACELVSDDGWVLHTTERWLFTQETAARDYLFALVRRLLPRAEVLAEGCSLAIGRHLEAWRIWLVTPRLPSVAEEAAKAIAEQSLTEAIGLIRRVFMQIRQLRSSGLVGVTVPGGNAALFLCEGRLVCLPLDLEESSSMQILINPVEQLAQLLEPWATGTVTAAAGINAEELEQTRRLWLELKGAA